MNKFPSKLTMVLSILVIAVLLHLRYNQKLFSKHHQLNFDWQKERVLQTWEESNLDSVSYNYLSLTGISEDVSPNNQFTYSVENQYGKRQYFRYIYHIQKGNQIEFRAVEWINGIPDSSFKRIILKESEVPMKKQKGKTVITIGDDYLLKDEAKYYRRKIAAESNFNFEGTKKDVFNYKHEAGRESSIQEVLNNGKEIPPAEIYILGWSSKQIFQKDFLNDADKLLRALSERPEAEKIIWLNAPKIKNQEVNESNLKLNQLLDNLNNNKLLVLDCYTFFENEKKEYLMPDSIHLNKQGYEMLAKQTLKLLK